MVLQLCEGAKTIATPNFYRGGDDILIVNTMSCLVYLIF